PETSPVLFALFFPAVWLLVGFLISYIGGWAELATYYRSEQPREAQTWRFQRCSMRWTTHYNGCLTIRANFQGLGLAMLFLFRAGHPPLFVPWHEIIVERGKTLFWKWTKFRFKRAPSVWIKFYGTIADEIRAQAGSSWPADDIPLSV